MKQNLVIILLTAAVMLLGVNLLEGHWPPTAGAEAGVDARKWTPFCNAKDCYVISSEGVVHDIEDTFGKILESCVAEELKSIKKKGEKVEEAQAHCPPWRTPVALTLDPNGSRQ